MILAMNLTPYRRHGTGCPHAKKGQSFTLCGCPIWCDGMLDGKRYRRSLDTRDWEIATRRMISLVAIGRPADDKPTGRTVKSAIDGYIADCEARGVRPSTITSYKRTLRTLPDTRLSQINIETISAWRAGRKVAAGTQRKELEHIRFFFKWCVTRKLIAENPALAIKPPRVDAAPTMPYTQEEVSALLSACDRIASDNPAENPYIRQRARCFVLLLLHSGLRRSDAAVLRRSALHKDGYLTLRIEKTHVPLKVQLPDEVAATLRRLPASNPEYFFWTGKSKPSTVTNNLWKTITRIGKLAEVHATPHRFRDTFACRLLENGADIRTVQKLLGHTSVRTTEKHYAPWVKSHQKLLDAATATLDFVTSSQPLVNVRKDRFGNAKRNIRPLSA